MNLAKIGDVVTKAKTWDPRKDAPDDLIRYIDIGSVSQDTKAIGGLTPIMGSEAPSRARQLVQAGDILVSTVRPNLNAVARVPEELDGATASTGFSVLRPEPDYVYPAYLFHWVRTGEFVAEMMRQATGQSYPAVSDKIVKASEILLPPLEEQKRIAGILDQAAELCRLRTRALDKLGTLGQAIFHEMFGSDAAPVIAKKTQLIGDFCEVSSGSTPSRANSAFYDGDTPWVKTGEVNGSVIADTEEKISEEAIIAARLKIYPPETVLVAMYGQGKTRGQVGILERPAATNQACAALVARDRIHPRFLFHQLLVSYDRLRDQGRGGNQPNLNAGMIKNFPIYVPDFLRQQEFVDKMQILEQQIARIYLNKDYLSSLFASLQHRAFRGEL